MVTITVREQVRQREEITSAAAAAAAAATAAAAACAAARRPTAAATTAPNSPTRSDTGTRVVLTLAGGAHSRIAVVIIGLSAAAVTMMMKADRLALAVTTLTANQARAAAVAATFIAVAGVRAGAAVAKVNPQVCLRRKQNIVDIRSMTVPMAARKPTARIIWI
jgi:hypothetical protein